MHGKIFDQPGEDNLAYVHDPPLNAAQIPGRAMFGEELK